MMTERLKKLLFYGTGDETYELFQQGCRFCWTLSSLGESDKAEIVYVWLVDMANRSKEFYEHQIGDPQAPDADVADGVWY